MKPSASKLALFSRCAYPFRSDIDVPEDTRGPAARLGSAVHRYIELIISGDLPVDWRNYSPDSFSAIADEFGISKKMMSALWKRLNSWDQYGPYPGHNTYPGETWDAEVTFALDAQNRSARILGRRLGRDYSAASPTEICGTADVVRWRGDRIQGVIDWKTGKQGSATRDQLLFFALCADLLQGGEPIECQNIFILDESCDFGPTIDIDELDLVAMHQVLLDAIGELEVKGGAPFRPGAWCRALYCPARTICPAWT